MKLVEIESRCVEDWYSSIDASIGSRCRAAGDKLARHEQCQSWVGWIYADGGELVHKQRRWLTLRVDERWDVPEKVTICPPCEFLGSVEEPINPEAWNWQVGNRQCTIVDTFWQTETSSIVVTSFPRAIEIKPGSATVPVFGIDPVILDPISGKARRPRRSSNELEGNNVEGALALSTLWPSIARTNYRDYKRYVETYVKPYPGLFYTGDRAARDEHGYIWIKDRINDVINASGHRLSTAEIESALVMHKAFFILKPEFPYDPTNETAFTKEPFLRVQKVIGPFAAPKKIYIVSDLPKTRSGKIIRRIMRKTVAGEGDRLNDLSTVAEPGVVDISKKKVAQSA
ncbi:hypothetical protein IW262DRAFT_1469134 [Armillaria fumosa]|nr:hypothetical protein IW262DRAFT_1469134 [Armillaria fumosa]